jgi:hypothetical protein
MPAAMICPNSVKRSSSVMVSMGQGLSPMGERCIGVQSFGGSELFYCRGFSNVPAARCYWFNFASSAVIDAIISSKLGGSAMNISAMAS